MNAPLYLTRAYDSVNKCFRVLCVLLFLLHVSVCRLCNYFSALVDCMANVAVRVAPVYLYTDSIVTIIVRTIITTDL